MILGARCSL